MTQEFRGLPQAAHSPAASRATPVPGRSAVARATGSARLGQSVPAAVRSAWRELLHGSSATIPALDALRSLAILLVFSAHAYWSFGEQTKSALAIGRFPLIFFGWTGVDLFFVLSGYLIGKQLWRELQRTGDIRIGRFLLRRGLRIWPYYFAFCGLTILLSRSPVTKFWPDLTFLSNYFSEGVSGGWSLSTEEQFYLLVPVLLFVVSRMLRLSRQWIVLLALLLALPVIRGLVLSLHGAHQHGADDLWLVTYTPFHTHADGLVAGLLLSWLGVVHPARTAARGFLGNIAVPALLVTTGLILRAANRDLFAFSGLAAVYGGATLFFLRDRSWFTRITGARVFHLGSRLSYSMYLNHFLVLSYLAPLLWHRNSGWSLTVWGFLGGYAVALTLSVAAAAITFTAIEWPFLQLRDRWLRRAAGTELPAA
jgi:peptidoglycan/LPS O-acetylase OafA/YrhL